MEPEYQEYRGHRIELRPREGRREVLAREAEHEEELELLIDDQLIRYGQLPGGSYALEDYAFDWRDDLIDLARRFIDYREKAEEIRREAESAEEN